MTRWVQNRPPALFHLPYEHITGCCPPLHLTYSVSPKITTPRHNSWVLVCNHTDQVHLSSWIQSQTHSRSRGYCPYMCTMVRVTGSFPGWSGYFQRKKIGKFERKFPLAHNTSYKGSKQSMFFSTTQFLLWIHRRTCVVAASNAQWHPLQRLKFESYQWRPCGVTWDFVPNSRGNKAAANLRPKFRRTLHEICLIHSDKSKGSSLLINSCPSW